MTFLLSSQDQSRFQLSSMSHIVNHTVTGYIPLPDFPDSQPEASLRDVDDRRHLYDDDDDDAGACAIAHARADVCMHCTCVFTPSRVISVVGSCWCFGSRH